MYSNYDTTLQLPVNDIAGFLESTMSSRPKDGPS